MTQPNPELTAHLAAHGLTLQTLAVGFDQAADYLTNKLHPPARTLTTDKSLPAESIEIAHAQLRSTLIKENASAADGATVTRLSYSDGIYALNTAAERMGNVSSPGELDEVLSMAAEGFAAVHGILDFFATQHRDSKAAQTLAFADSLQAYHHDPKSRRPLENMPIPAEIREVFGHTAYSQSNDSADRTGADMTQFFELYLNAMWRQGPNNTAELRIPVIPQLKTNDQIAEFGALVTQVLDYYRIARVDFQPQADGTSLVRISREDYHACIAPNLDRKVLGPAEPARAASTGKLRYQAYTPSGQMGLN